MSTPKRRVGMLDSGLGGLTVLGALRALTNGVDVVYYADTAHVPYGDRPLKEVAMLGAAIVDRLLTHDPAAIIIASGTTCAAFDAVGWPQSPVPLLGVVEPVASVACEATRNGTIGVVATNATVKSGVFERAIFKIKPDAQVKGVGAPALVPIVESGEWASAYARDAVASYCRGITKAGCDTVILGCTHFPHLMPWFVDALGSDVLIIDGGVSCAQQAARILAGLEPQSSRLTFEVSGNAEDFTARATLLSGMRIDDVQHVESLAALDQMK